MKLKIYVSVVSICCVNGSVLPLAVVWKDGTCYEVEEVTSVRLPEHYAAIGAGDRYTVRIQGRERYLYFDVNEGPFRWYVEGK